MVGSWYQAFQEFGDFATPLGLISSPALALIGLDMTVSPSTDSTSVGLESEYAGYGLDFVHGGFIEATPNSLASVAGLNVVNNPEAPASDFLGAWVIFRDPEVNPYSGVELEGEYGAQALFLVSITASNYDGVSFTMQFEATP